MEGKNKMSNTPEAKAVLAEFKGLLKKYDVGSSGRRSDGNFNKYVRYTEFLFDKGIVKTKADFFKPETEAMAKRFYMEMAQKFPHKTRGPQKKFTDLMHGFKDFVKLVRLDEGSPLASAPAPPPAQASAQAADASVPASPASTFAAEPRLEPAPPGVDEVALNVRAVEDAALAEAAAEEGMDDFIHELE